MTKWRIAAIAFASVLLACGWFASRTAWEQYARALVLEEYKQAGFMERETGRQRYVKLKLQWRNRRNYDAPDLRSIAIDGRHYQAFDISALRLFPELESVDLDWTAVADISSLGNCRELKNVSLSYTRVRDFRVFERFPQLTSLTASGCNIERIAFPDANQVTRLYLRESRIRDMSFLSSLTLLTHLDLNNTRGDDYSVIGNCQRLQCLLLNGTELRTTSFLGKLTRLETLRLRRAAVTELSSIRNLRELKILDILGTRTNKDFLRQLDQLENLHVTWDGNGQDLADAIASRKLHQLEMEISPEFQLGKLAVFKNLKTLKLSGPINDIRALEPLPELEFLDLSATQVVDVASLAKLPKLHDLVLNSYLFNHKSPSLRDLGFSHAISVWLERPDDL